MSIILIVDDEPSARETLVAMLEGQGYQLEMAKNGSEALEIAKRVLPDLILLDVMMPAMDGFEVCRRVRSTPQLAEVPIIILTALDNHASLMTGIEAGADDFLTKPIERRELVSRVRTITRLNRYRSLLAQRENLQKMAERVVVAQEDERKRLSRELHDELGQALTIQLISLHNLQEEISVPGDALYERLQTLYDQTNEIYENLHQFVQDLRPPALNALSLKNAIQTYCTEFTRRTGLPIVFDADQAFPELSNLYNITLYRVLQEALTNIVKHAQANKIWVELSVDGDMIALIVQDNGHGFEYEKSQSEGIGLTSLRERLTIAGGRFKITSSLERGTILAAYLPLRDDFLPQEEE